MSKKFTLEELARFAVCDFSGDPRHVITFVNSLESAEPHEVSFLANPRYRDLLASTKAGIVCIDTTTPLIEGKNFLISPNPSKTFQIITDLILSTNTSGFENIHPSAVIHPSACLAEGVAIGPHVTIDQKVTIDKGTKIYGNVFIGAGVSIGENCIIYPCAVIREHCTLHHRVILQPGAVIGSCGFGYLTDPEGHHHKIPQLGNVILEDDVEVGANSTIDRARFKHTYISKGTKIDNLVQIGHNVTLGKDNLIVSQTGISGSAKTGDRVVLGGQSGVMGHLEIGNDIQIASRGGVSKTVTQAGQYGGYPLQPLQEFHRHRVYLRNLEKYVKRIEELENKIVLLEKKLYS
ncbi:MAG: UDP-3-O-(3-hydroxymyristoyl)glucosamine N-acyltransferase [Chlamydiae bacterium]|nr:UDP-3-O-(3-hydroxymyristoyl)glucosamine N-acyltransferase [Chlamydiota bacterium]